MDWKNTISELLENGLTQEQIAKAIGVGQSTIAALFSGAQKDMRWSSGDRLMALHRRTIKRRHRKSGAQETIHA